MDMLTRLLQRAIDLHVHTAPSLFPRCVDEVEATQQAAEAGMRAILAKSHHHSTAPDALLLRKHVLHDAKTELLGAVVLNNHTGGLNPYVVDMTIRLGGRMVWFPTFSAQHHIDYSRVHRKTGFPAQADKDLEEVAVPVLADGGELLPEARTIMRLIAKADIIMSPGHASPQEVLTILQGACEAGVQRMVVNHPDFIIGASETQVREYVEVGAFIEHSLGMYMEWPIERLSRWIEVVGPEKTLFGSDLGQRGNPPPVEGWKTVLRKLLDAGVHERDIAQIIKANPAWLLKIEQ